MIVRYVRNEPGLASKASNQHSYRFIAMNHSKKYINELIGLDLLRFMLAAMVVVVHYYHFYGPFPGGPFVDQDSLITEQPFYNVLWPIYRYGRNAVQVFWLISGVIFYSVYYREIGNREVGFRQFSFLRFTRLYPLHFLMLLTTLFAQLAFFTIHHAYFVYTSNDVTHFFLQLFFIANWIPGEPLSFNVPMWSVSVEIFVYLIFYALAALSLLNGKRLPVLIVCCYLFIQFGILKPFETCLLYFFSGCLLARFMEDRMPMIRLFVYYMIVSVVTAAFVKLIRVTLSEQQLEPYFKTLLEIRNIPASSTIVLFFIVAFRNITSPGLISLFKRMGNMTYSLYAVHFTVQIVMFLLINPAAYTTFNRPVYLFIFLGVSITAGWIAFEYFERPVQKYLRARFERKAAGNGYSMLPTVVHSESPPSAGY